VGIADALDSASYSSRRGSTCVVRTRERTAYRIFVSCKDYEPRRIDVVSPPFDGCAEHVVELHRSPTGILVLHVGETWSGRARVSFDEDGKDWLEAPVVMGRVELDGVPAGDHSITLVVIHSDEERTASTSFDARVEPDQVCERTLSLR
jgi:hypothetical protein